MAEADRRKWDARYASGNFLIEEGAPSAILVRHMGAARRGRAMDVAAGMGRNALYLARHGFAVDALDISPVGLAHLERAAAAAGLADRVRTVVVDLEVHAPGKAIYDLVIMANYLERRLIPRLAAALCPGGLLLIDTFLDDPASRAVAMNPAHLLKPGELGAFFGDDFEILEERAYPRVCMDGSERLKQAFAVRRRP